MKALCRCALAAFLTAIATASVADERILQFLEDRYTHALMRQVGDEANGGPKALGVADCVDLRVLSRGQRNHARRLGRIFERSGVHIDLIATSRWCRAIRTAKLLQLRPVTPEPVLDAIAPDDTEAAEAILDLLDGMRANETALLVTHAGNIMALTGRESHPGEVIVIRLKPGADLEILGSFRLE